MMSLKKISDLVSQKNITHFAFSISAKHDCIENDTVSFIPNNRVNDQHSCVRKQNDLNYQVQWYYPGFIAYQYYTELHHYLVKTTFITVVKW